MAWVGSIQLKTTTFIFLLIHIHHCYGEYCSYLNGRTSDNKDPCTELEHCLSDLDQTGQCPGNQCERGWMGPGCQYVNLAFNPLNHDMVFDGDMTTQRPISEATVKLNGTFVVNAFIIHTRRFSGSLIVRDGHQNVLLQKSVQEVSPTIVLPHPVLTDILNMQFSNSIDIKEIEVFGGKDVALWKPTNQSSTYSERILNKWVYFTSDKAVDGSGDGNFDNLSCTHTAASQSKRPSWNVNLGKAYSIIAIKIANRNDNQGRINGFKLFGTAENGSKLLIYSDPHPYRNRGEIVLDSNHMLDTPVSVITIEGPGDTEKILTLCEVFVFACLPTSAEGTDQCRSFCPKNCQAVYSCKNGCPVCQDGWMGLYCENPITCQPPVSTDAPNIITDKQKYNYSETITFSCHRGFDLQGKAERICTENGALQPPLPICTAIKCKAPAFTSASHISTDRVMYNYSDVIRFSCSKGFNIQGDQNRKCTGEESFRPPFPNCTEVRCKTPNLQQKNVMIVPNDTDYEYNSTILFKCKMGFSLKGSKNATCHQNASFWFIGGTPKCEEVRCKTPMLQQKNVMIEPNDTDYEYNSTILFKCKMGFSLKGSQNATCHQNASFWFVGGTPKCEEVRCKTPMLQQKDVMIIPNKTDHEYNSTIMFECTESLSLKGSQKATCQQNASFRFIDGVQPECEVSEIDHSLSGAFVAGISIGSLAVIGVVVAVIIIVLRKRTTKKPESKYYKNDALSLDEIDHQYAEVNPNRAKKNKDASKQEQTSNEQTTTYYNMNSPDAVKAKQARQEVYYEFSPECRPSGTAIPVSEFKNYVESKKGNPEFFAEQFKKFNTGLQFPATAAVAPGNKSKNKYKNIYPYDETRVLLKIEKGSMDSDFINASFIHGFGNVKSYIAAQGPLINTLDDFWWMVWNEKCDKIVMLTNLFEDDKVKCIQYWPDSDTMDTRNMKLEVVVSETFADFTIRTFNLINGKESRTIRQFHFTAWPDKGVPAYASSLVHFHSKVIHTPGTLKGPMVVHCSAGIGRTGTFIALNYLVQQAKESGNVDVFECVKTLRRQRLNMVQTLEQYKFLHYATLEALMCTSSDPSTSKFPQLYEDLFKEDAETGKRNIDLNFENLDVALSTLPESAYSMAKNSTNRKKNRYSNILPVDSEMPEIWDEENNPIYINAVFLPAYKSKRSFIATQMPLKDTVVDFWRLLYEQQVSTIVMLNQLDSDKPKENIGKYWPKDLNAVSECGPFRITKKGLTEGKDFTIIDLCCHKEGQNEDESKLRLFQCHFWPDPSTVPTSVLAFLKLINDVELHHDRNNSGPLVVHCMNGAEKSGLFCVMQVVLERMKIEQDVAIHHVIQQMRSIRPSIIPNVEQFKFCHDVVLEFLKQFDDYSNFQ